MKFKLFRNKSAGENANWYYERAKKLEGKIKTIKKQIVETRKKVSIMNLKDIKVSL